MLNLKLVLVHLLNLTGILVKCDLSVTNEIRNKDIQDCLSNFLDKYIKATDYAIYFLEENFAANIIHPKLILKNANIIKDIEKPKIYLFYLKTTKLNEIFKNLSSHFSWNPRATFIFITKLNEISEISKIASHYFVDNIKFFNINNISKSNDICEEHKENILQPINELKKIKTWTNYTLKVLAASITPYVFITKKNSLDGIEIRCLQTVQDKMKFGIKFLEHNYKTWGLRLKNGTYTDMFNKLQNYEADIVLGMWPTNFTHILDFDVTIPYLQDALVWMVPKAQILPHWKRLAIIFPEEIWLAIGCIIIIIPIFWALGGKILSWKEITSFTNLQTCIFKSISVILCVTLPKYPKTLSLRIMFIIWVYSSLILMTLYQSKLLAILIQPQYENQISEIDELLDSGMRFGANINVKSLYGLQADLKEKQLYDRIEFCDLTLKCPNRTAFQRDFATAKAKLAGNFLILQYYTNSDGVPIIYLFKSTILSHYINMVFAKGHPIFDEFNKNLYRILEAGLLLKWKNDIMDEKTREYINKNEEDKSMVLSLDTMAAPFKILLVGYTIACFVFVLEIIVGRIDKKVK